MIDFASIETITFDCYGTLIDWESGILKAVREFTGPCCQMVSDKSILLAYSKIEGELEAGPFIIYRDVLAESAKRIAAEFGTTITDQQSTIFADSLTTWQPFPDTVPALRSLSRHCKLGILSNVDDELFVKTNILLQVEFEFVVTAQQVRSYKPNHAHFTEGQKRGNLKKDTWLHAAQSLYHDVTPCNALGIQSVWVNRPSRNGESGATINAISNPGYEVPDIQTLANLIASAK